VSDLAGAIVAALRRRANGEQLRVGVFHRKEFEALGAVIAEGHWTAVAGDNFRALFLSAQRLGSAGKRSYRLAEARFDALPFRPGSLDALVLTCGLPRGLGAEAAMKALKRFLAPGGALVFPHPVTDGKRGRFARLLRLPFWKTLPPLSRHSLCRDAMSAGYCDVGQIAPAGRGAVPWIVTFATSGRRRACARA